MDTPTTTVESPNYSESELERRTNAFFSAGGAWEVMNAVKTEIEKTITPLLGRSDSHYASIPRGQLNDLLLDHFGLRGEFVTLASALQMVELRDDLGMTAAEAIETFPQAIAMPSALSRTLANPSGGSIDAIAVLAQKTNPALGKNIDGSAETTLTSLARCADEIEKWAVHNKETFSPELFDTIGTKLKDYRAALEGMNEYLDYAQHYLNKGTKVKEVNNAPELQ
jgi:hypothetical protein